MQRYPFMAVSGHDVRALSSAHRLTQEMRLRDDDLLTTRVEKVEGRLDLGPHAARGEMALIEVAAAFGCRDAVEVLLFRRAEIQRHLVNVGREDQLVGAQLLRQQAGRRVLVDDGGPRTQRAVRLANDGYAATAGRNGRKCKEGVMG